MVDQNASGDALLVGMPLRHLEEARAVCGEHGRVVLPAGSPGDLDRAGAGTPIYLMASDAGDAEVPAATWGATLVRRVHAPDAASYPELLPPGWLADRLERAADALVPVAVSPLGDDDEADADRAPSDDDQAYFEVTDLAPLPKRAWIFTNEVVSKQERGGRAYFPRSPRLFRLPD